MVCSGHSSISSGKNRMKKNITTNLVTFLKEHCANFNRHCKVLKGKRCGYFEKAVLGPPDYKFRLPVYDYQKLFAQYAELTSSEKQDVKVRRCECGEPLRPRHRYCESCKKARRKETYRKSRKTEKTREHQKRYAIKYPEKIKAQNAVRNATRYDKLPRPDTLQCHYCPAQAEQYHHHKGYAPEHWLDVVPACRNCHTKINEKRDLQNVCDATVN